MDDGVTGKLIAHLGAFGSGELKTLAPMGAEKSVTEISIGEKKK